MRTVISSICVLILPRYIPSDNVHPVWMGLIFVGIIMAFVIDFKEATGWQKK